MITLSMLLNHQITKSPNQRRQLRLRSLYSARKKLRKIIDEKQIRARCHKVLVEAVDRTHRVSREFGRRYLQDTEPKPSVVRHLRIHKKSKPKNDHPWRWLDVS